MSGPGRVMVWRGGGDKRSRSGRRDSGGGRHQDAVCWPAVGVGEGDRPSSLGGIRDPYFRALSAITSSRRRLARRGGAAPL